MPKKTLKAVMASLVKVRKTVLCIQKKVQSVLVQLASGSDAEVREAACAAIAAAMAVIGEKPALTMLADVADDRTKMAKVR